MDEARRVIERLERIESLRRERAPAATLLAEVRALLTEGECWVEAEHGGAARSGTGDVEQASAALELCRERLAVGEGVVREAVL